MKNCVLTIGKFEGIHLGHQALLNKVVRRAQILKIASAVMVFEPHPYIFFGNADYKPLFTNEERNKLLTNIGVDYIFTCPFDENFAALSPQKFCKKIFDEYSAKVVIVGKDYRFGKDRVGDVELLREEAESYGAKVEIISSVEQDAGGQATRTISTSNIRKLLTDGNIAEVNLQFGFPFFITGIAAKARQSDRKLGFTLNVHLSKEKFLPSDGVYVTRTKVNDATYHSITNIGLHSTVDGCVTRSATTHLPDYTGADPDGECIKVEFLTLSHLNS